LPLVGPLRHSPGRRCAGGGGTGEAAAAAAQWGRKARRRRRDDTYFSGKETKGLFGLWPQSAMPNVRKRHSAVATEMATTNHSLATG